MDGLLGLVGSQIHLTQSARSDAGLTLDEFKKVFWAPGREIPCSQTDFT